MRGILDGRRDQNGLSITRVYARSGDLYAIYLAGGDVLVHLADKPDLRPAQRRNLSEVADNRWELDRLADGWRHGDRYHRELASSLGQALEGECERANVRMRDAIFELSKLALAAGRLQYVLYSAGWALAMLATLYLFSEVLYPVLTLTPSDNIWLAGKAGVVGAFMSIAFGIRNRTVAPDNDRVGNALESGLRMSIGLFGAGFLLLALKSGIIGRVFVGNDSATGSQIATWHATVTLGFVCGFLERLIPSLLERSATEARVTGEVANQANVSAADKAGKAVGDNKAGSGQGRSGTPPGQEARPGGQAGPVAAATSGSQAPSS